MPGNSLLAPVPRVHLEEALKILETKEFVLFGSEAYDVFEKTDPGTKLLIYVSHANAEPEVAYVGTYGGLVGDPMEMRSLEGKGYRPKSTNGEKWSFYWKAQAIEALSNPIPLTQIQLQSGKYLQSYPRGPVHVLN